MEEESGEAGQGVQDVDEGDDNEAGDQTRQCPHRQIGMLRVVVQGVVHVIDGGEDAADAMLADRLPQILIRAGAVGVQHRVYGG